MMKNISDEKLIKAAIDGNTEAEEMLKNRIESLILPTIKKRGIQDSGEDMIVLANQIEEKVINALPEFHFKVSFQTWVYRITVNMLIEYQSRMTKELRISQIMNGK